MAPYRRRRRWFRRQRGGRRRGPYRRFRKARRRPRQRWTARRVKKLFKRKKRRVTLWDPDNKAKCIINGFMFGIICGPLNITNRLWTTVFTPTEIKAWISGGGVNLRMFSLRFLYEEHRLFRNCWSRTNDGFDLAQYLGTKIYLPPHPTVDYVFWWDTDLTRYTDNDYYRLHPAKILCQRNVVFVRNQIAAGNKRTHKLFIKPPANITSQWKFQSDWYDFPLFTWGMTLINWYEPFFRQQSGFIPYFQFPTDQVYKYTTTGGVRWRTLKDLNMTLAYSPLVDTGKGNRISVGFLSGSGPTDVDDFREATQTTDLPYWFSCWGQNISWDFGVSKKNTDTGNVVYVSFTWPEWTVSLIENPGTQRPNWSRFCMIASNARLFATSGWFVMSSTKERINIPVLYKSYWKWGGTVLTKQPVTALLPTTNQVSVKNPGTVGQSVIRPGDLRNGLLTADALRRFLQPSKLSDERGPEPWEEQPPWYTTEEEYDKTGSEAKKSQKECEKESDIPSIIRCLSRRVQRERTQRRSLHQFLKSLLKPQ
nr:ORF1 [Torque teno felis virus]